MPQLLLLQARLVSDPMLAHEHLCVATQAHIEPGDLIAHNLVNGMPPDTVLSDSQGLVIE